MCHVQTSEARPGKQNFQFLQATQIHKSEETNTFNETQRKENPIITNKTTSDLCS